MTILFFSFSLFLIFLIVERVLINQHHISIPLRITVTGTRGKTTVVRLLASVLRENGKRVFAKTTGASPQWILPDGSEQTIKRRGMPTILEQKKMLQLAARGEVDVLISEVMSIHPENHWIESQKILAPHIVILTNIRDDHRDAMGSTDQELIESTSLDFPKNAHVFTHQKEMPPQLNEIVKAKNLTLHVIPDGFSAVRGNQNLNLQFSENFDLVFAVADHLGVKKSTIHKGVQKTHHDLGTIGAWIYKVKRKSIYCINGFSANEPQSTKQVLEKVKACLPPHTSNWNGILNCRSDRGDRTLQWIDHFKKKNDFHFSQLFVIGDHIHAVKRSLPHIHAVTKKNPEQIMQTIVKKVEDQSVLFGIGNFGGLGEKLTAYWKETGEAYDI